MTVRVNFLGQPFDSYGQIADVLEEQLLEETGGTLRLATAWAKRSGLARLEGMLARFRSQGGFSVAVMEHMCFVE